MKSRIGLAAVLATAFLSTPTQSLASAPCDARERLVEALASKFKEKPVSRGLTDTGQVIEVFASTTGSFSVVLSLPTGVSCLMSSGEHWYEIKTVPTKDKPA